MTSERRWEQQADQWVKWARAPGHDSYWYYADAFFNEIVPSPTRLTLEIGCGEGRVARDLTARGHSVVAVDSSPTLVRYAVEVDSESDYLVADSACLPFANSEFDIVVAYNSLQDVSDMSGTIQEAARVLSAQGRFCICITHPLADAGAFNDRETDPEFVIPDSYFGRRVFEGTAERDGLTMTFHGFAYPLEDYARALEDAGFLIERVREPVPRNEHLIERPSLAPWQRVPAYLSIRALRSTTDGIRHR